MNQRVIEEIVRRLRGQARRLDALEIQEERETFTIATLPASAAPNTVVYVSDGLKPFEITGTGTGNWMMWDDDNNEWIYFCIGDCVILLDGVTKTVKAVGGDYTTIQDAFNFFAPGKLISDCTIDVDAGTYAETVVFSNLLVASEGQLTVEGDTRELAGLSYVNGVDTVTYAAWTGTTVYSGTDPRSIVYPTATNETGLMYMATTGGTSGAAEPVWPTAIGGTVVDGTVTWTAIGVAVNPVGITNGGAALGGCQFLVTGGVLSVVVSGGNPDFDADGWVSGDKVLTWDGTSFSELTLTGVANNTLTTAAWPANITNVYSTITLLPNRIIVPASGEAIINDTSGVVISGFYLKSVDDSAIQMNTGNLKLDNCVVRGYNNGIFMANQNALDADSGANTFIASNTGTTNRDALNANNQSNVDIDYASCVASGVTINTNSNLSAFRVLVVDTPNSVSYAAVYARTGSTASCDRSQFLRCPYGAYAVENSIILINRAFALGSSAYGFRALNQGEIRAVLTAARDCSVGYRAENFGYIDAAITSANNNNNTTNYSPAASATFGNNGSMIIFS
jgi:hypothetical protein